MATCAPSALVTTTSSTAGFTASAEVKQQAATSMAASIVAAARLVAHAYQHGGILYTFGNGGSAADAQHLAGEMVGRYYRERRPLPAVALSTDPSALVTSK